MHMLATTGLKDIAPTPLDPVVIAFDGQRITLARGPAHIAKIPAKQAQAQTQARIAQLPVVQRHVSQVGSAVTITRPVAAPVAESSVVAASDLAPPALNQEAESLRVAPDQPIRDAAPIGGINPATPANAYVLGADGTSQFEIAVDATGTATKCAITKSSGYQVLDDEVCKAALKTKFSPRTIGGKPVAGLYRDAYTFKPPTKN
jgi:TonB family protein